MTDPDRSRFHLSGYALRNLRSAYDEPVSIPVLDFTHGGLAGGANSTAQAQTTTPPAGGTNPGPAPHV